MAKKNQEKNKETEKKQNLSINFTLTIGEDIDIITKTPLTYEQLLAAYLIVFKDIVELKKRIDYAIPPAITNRFITVEIILKDFIKSLTENLREKYSISSKEIEAFKKIIKNLNKESLENLIDKINLNDPEKKPGEDSNPNKNDKEENFD